ncbi:MAG: pyridoxamine 5'-phosphate oxidase family protein [Methanomethylovorans sp.]|uniref:pyridoxamine 5'-phosphate oxidase family protein n=1 Tax=Methanomethylovorans sp. TaxID=2758717 RepID=UPI003530A002
MTGFPMLRKERKMNVKDAENFLEKSEVGRLAMCHNNEPYVVPMLYYYDQKNNEILLHCAKKGRKIEAISSNNSVCFEVDEMKSIVSADVPCEFDLLYRSVIATGKALLINDQEMKAKALNLIFEKYASLKGSMPIDADMAKGTQIIQIRISDIVGKEAKGATIPYP